MVIANVKEISSWEPEAVGFKVVSIAGRDGEHRSDCGRVKRWRADDDEFD